MKRRQLVMFGAALAACLAAPLLVQQDYELNVLFRIALFAALGLAWNLVGGYTGQLLLGHAAFFGIGGYGLALCHARLGVPPWPALLLGVLAAMGAAVVIGAISFRLRGPYFTLATIAFAEVLRMTAKNLVGVTGGDVGVQVAPLFSGHISRAFYWSAVLLAAGTFLLTTGIARSKFGYYLMAIREDEDTAQSVGVNTARCKLQVLVLTAAITAAGGALYASLFLFIVPDQMLSIDISNEIAIVAMLGGAGTALGPIVGSIVLETAAELFKTVFREAHLLIYGVLIVVVVLFLPDGIVGTLRQRTWRRTHATVPPAATGVERG